MRKEIVADKGAPPKGPYSPAIVAEGPLVFAGGRGHILGSCGPSRSFLGQSE